MLIELTIEELRTILSDISDEAIADKVRERLDIYKRNTERRDRDTETEAVLSSIAWANDPLDW
jgi:arsenate reductase-like glutaredoxin family protein|tara:strand:- start:242 stop:430 length:189 start_codon:yes stop_codon:yes gene_type:complete